MRIYISGKIGRQMPDEATLQSFAHAEQVLQAMGFETFNPDGQRLRLDGRDFVQGRHEPVSGNGYARN